MFPPVLELEDIGKKFRRSLTSGILYQAQDFCRRMLKQAPAESLRKDEFWALRGVSFELQAGKCIGIIGPNGAGKSTLLKLVNGDLRANRGQIRRQGRIKSLIRLGTGLQPLLSGRENIYVGCAALGLSKAQTDARLDAIVDFAGIEKSLDTPVRHYSDGMYARLEFSIATSVVADILLIDEVLAVGDIAFQLRCLERLEQLKRAGAGILFVSHSEMNVRQIANECLLLFDGEVLGYGEPDALFLKYYASVGYSNRQFLPLQGVRPPSLASPIAVLSVCVAGHETPSVNVLTGASITLRVNYAAERRLESVAPVLEFRNSGDVLAASADASSDGQFVAVDGRGTLSVLLPFVGLSAGVYRIAAGFRDSQGEWVGYRSEAFELVVADRGHHQPYRGITTLEARISQA